MRSVGRTRYGRSQRPLTVDLPRPFARMLLRFVPFGADPPVVAVDDVTVEGVADLSVGNEITIPHLLANLRIGWLERADRSPLIENRCCLHGLITIPFVILLAVGRRQRRWCGVGDVPITSLPLDGRAQKAKNSQGPVTELAGPAWVASGVHDDAAKRRHGEE